MICLAFITCFVFINSKGVFSTKNNFSEEPANTAIFQGQRTELRCTLANPLDSDGEEIRPSWKFRSSNVNDEKTIFNGYSVTVNFTKTISVDDSLVGQFHLIINDTQKKHAGTYTCFQGLNLNDLASAELIVLESDPTCESNNNEVEVEGDTVRLECRIRFKGNTKPVAPQLEWNQIGGRPVTEHRTQTDSTDDFVISTITFNATREAKFECRMFFNETALLQNHSSNIPELTATCQSTNLNVTMYAPTSIQFSPASTYFQPGDVIACSAESHPIPSYFWTDLDSLNVTHGSQLVILESMVGDVTHRYNCTALQNITSRSVQWVTSKTLEFTVPEPVDIRMLIVVAVVASVVLIIVVALAICCKKDRKKDKERVESDDMYWEIAEIPDRRSKPEPKSKSEPKSKLETKPSKPDPQAVVYAQVNKPGAKDKKNCNNSFEDGKKKNLRYQYSGSDGTVYTVVNPKCSKQNSSVSGRSTQSATAQKQLDQFYSPIAHDMPVPQGYYDEIADETVYSN